MQLSRAYRNWIKIQSSHLHLKLITLCAVLLAGVSGALFVNKLATKPRRLPNELLRKFLVTYFPKVTMYYMTEIDETGRRIRRFQHRDRTSCRNNVLHIFRCTLLYPGDRCKILSRKQHFIRFICATLIPKATKLPGRGIVRILFSAINDASAPNNRSACTITKTGVWKYLHVKLTVLVRTVIRVY